MTSTTCEGNALLSCGSQVGKPIQLLEPIASGDLRLVRVQAGWPVLGLPGLDREAGEPEYRREGRRVGGRALGTELRYVLPPIADRTVAERLREVFAELVDEGAPVPVGPAVMLTVAFPHLVVEIGLVLRHHARSAEVPDGGDATRKDLLRPLLRLRLFRGPPVGFALPCCLLPLRSGAGAVGWVEQLREFRLDLWLDRRGLLETVPPGTEPPVLVVQRDREREGRQLVVFERPSGDLLGHVVEVRSAERPIGTED